MGTRLRASVWFLATALMGGCTAGVSATPNPGGNDGGGTDVPLGIDAPVIADVRPTVDIAIPTPFATA